MQQFNLEILWVAFLFSQLRQANLQEFLQLSGKLAHGMSWSQPEFAEHTLDWRRLQIVCAHLLQQALFTRFCAEVQQAQEGGIHFTYPGLKDFPPSFLDLQDVPFFLSYRGTPVWLDKHGLAIVGSREPSELSTVWCENELPDVLRKLPIFSVSGGARGVDQMAHRLSLRLGLPTVVLLPSGLGNLYPSSIAEWTAEICLHQGALLSEYMPRVRMNKGHFQRRNRLIAGLSITCLVVEARRCSGTLITAQQALEQNKPVLVLPSHPGDAAGRGGLELLQQGATPICHAQDLLEFLLSELQFNPRPRSDLVENYTQNH